MFVLVLLSFTLHIIVSLDNHEFAQRMIERQRSAEFHNSQAEARRISESIRIKNPPMLRPLDNDSPMSSPGIYGSSPPVSPPLSSPSPGNNHPQRSSLYVHVIFRVFDVFVMWSLARDGVCASWFLGLRLVRGPALCWSVSWGCAQRAVLWFVQCFGKRIRDGVACFTRTAERCRETAPLNLSKSPRPIPPQYMTGEPTRNCSRNLGLSAF